MFLKKTGTASASHPAALHQSNVRRISEKERKKNKVIHLIHT
jgi:hypothetical protein